MQGARDAWPIAELPANGETLLEMGCGAVVALLYGDMAEASKRVGDVAAITEFAKDRHALLGKRARRSIVALHRREARKMHERNRDAPAVAELAVDGEALLVKGACPRVIALLVGEQALIVEHRADAAL
ncbi:MAG TPA: hypothetical protein VFS06_00605, partial [Casimicrobiaceae bacterium]|nr:hypothetical protein [Casimicrobiaceae bacterium]